MIGDTIKATVEGRTYEIPEVWIVGRCTGARARGEDDSVAAAIGVWVYQTKLAEMEGR